MIETCHIIEGAGALLRAYMFFAIKAIVATPTITELFSLAVNDPIRERKNNKKSREQVCKGSVRIQSQSGEVLYETIPTPGQRAMESSTIPFPPPPIKIIVAGRCQARSIHLSLSPLY